MTYGKAKKIQNGSKVIVKKTGETKTVLLTTKCIGATGKKYIDILCEDYTSYYNFEIE